MKLLSLLVLILICNVAVASTVEEYIKEGIQFHDRGEYEQAATKYKMALELEPNNSLALYELTLSYMYSRQNEACIETAKRGLELDSKLNNEFIASLGSCYSQNGNMVEAISAFEDGLKTNPNNSKLHLNIAVTLSNIRKDKKAIYHLKEAIKHSHNYASPYYFIAEMYRTTNYVIPAISFYMQFVLLEPNSTRSQDASKKIIYLLNQGLKKKDNGGMDIIVNSNSPKDDGNYTKYELALSIAAAGSMNEENGSLKPEEKRYTDALTSFITICSEMAGEGITSTFTWNYALKNMTTLQAQGVYNTFAYILVSRAGIQGAVGWLAEHENEIKKMSTVIKTLDL